METIGVIGIGKLGICFALNIERKGYKVIGVDVSDKYVQQINNKTLESSEPVVEDYLKNTQNFSATTNLEELINNKMETIFVFVATPSLPDGSYDHSQIEKISNQLIKFGKRERKIHLVIGCTTMPGYCNQLAEKMSSYNYTVSYNPEFIAQGNIIKDQQRPDQVLIGEANVSAGNKIQEIYENLCENEPIYCRMDRLSAEICKIATNCFLTTKISFANSIGDLATKTGANADKILSAIGSDSRIGNKYLNYGFGFGGPCFPRDNRALGKFANESGYPLLISDATDLVNRKHLDFQYNHYLKMYHKDETIVFDGITYKKGSNLLDESQQLALAIKLAKVGRKIKVIDHKDVIEKLQERYDDLFIYQSV